MSENHIFSFSVSSQDGSRLELIQAIKENCRRTGQSFSYVCLEALKQYTEASNVAKK